MTVEIPSTPRIWAAGAVLWRRNGTDIEVALVHRPKYDDWSLPKGKVEQDEHLTAAAVREVGEETGYRIALGRWLGRQRYPVNGLPKEVHYWAGEAGDGEFHPHKEIDELQWAELEGARRRLTRSVDAEILDSFAAGPVPTSALVIVRHADAVDRDDWEDDDEQRPLNEMGLRQARQLVPIFAAFAPRRVISSPSRRCTDSVAPYADFAMTNIETFPELSEAGHERAPEFAPALIRELVSAGTSALVCSHRPVLPSMLDTVRATAAGGTGLKALPDDDPEPAEMLVCHVHEGSVVATERYAPSPGNSTVHTNSP